jgi:hypothetical protein
MDVQLKSKSGQRTEFIDDCHSINDSFRSYSQGFIPYDKILIPEFFQLTMLAIAGLLCHEFAPKLNDQPDLESLVE